MKTENYTPSPFSTHTIRIILNPSPSTHTHAASNYFVFFQENYLKETKIKKKLKGSAHTFFCLPLLSLCTNLYWCTCCTFSFIFGSSTTTTWRRNWSKKSKTENKKFRCRLKKIEKRLNWSSSSSTKTRRQLKRRKRHRYQTNIQSVSQSVSMFIEEEEKHTLADS